MIGIVSRPDGVCKSDQEPQKGSLRKAINAHCKSCNYDSSAKGSWRAQVTLCSILGCELYPVRPTTDKIARSVFEYYGVTDAEIARLTPKNGAEGRFSEKSDVAEGPGKGAQ